MKTNKTKKEFEQLQKRCDDLWERIIKIRAGFVCEMTDEKWELKYLVAHHIAGKQKSWLRWNLDNGVCLYSGSHFLVHSQDTTIAHYCIEKLKQKRGKDWYQSLLDAKKYGARVSLGEIKKIYEYLWDIYQGMEESSKQRWSNKIHFLDLTKTIKN